MGRRLFGRFEWKSKASSNLPKRPVPGGKRTAKEYNKLNITKRKRTYYDQKINEINPRIQKRSNLNTAHSSDRSSARSLRSIPNGRPNRQRRIRRLNGQYSKNRIATNNLYTNITTIWSTIRNICSKSICRICQKS